MVKKVEVGHFVEVKEGAKVKFGLDKGELLYVTASGYYNDKPKDPYSFRLVFIAAKVVDGHILDPDTNKGVLVDAKYLRVLGEARSKPLREALEKDAEGWVAKQEAQEEAANPA